jgi:hypothetical protein
MIERPKFGQHIRVISDWSRYLAGFAPGVPRIHVHEGIVRDSASYDELGTFRLFTQDKFDPIKVVCMEYVTRIEYIPGETGEAPPDMVAAAEQAEQPVVGSYEVKGSKGDIYVVTRTGSKFECTCPAGVHGRNCKHVAGVKRSLGFK